MLPSIRLHTGLLAVCLLTSIVHAAEPATSAPQPADWHLFSPFWNSTTVYGESLFFVKEDDGGLPYADLLMAPAELKTLRSADRKTTYELGKDYLWKAGSRRIELPQGSRIPFRKKAELYPAAGQPNGIGHKTGQPKVNLLFGEGHFYHDQQCEADYRVAPGSWQGVKPEYAGGNLPGTMALLKEKRRLTIGLSGDSISTGCNASGCSGIGVPPFQPSYGELVVQGLRQAYGGDVVFHNFAVGGWKSSNGVNAAARLAEVKPDLVLVAYGMNDVGGRNPAAYRENIRKIMATVRGMNPKAEFVLVASMRGNPEWQNTPEEMFPKYRDALAELCGEGVVLADMTAMWTDLLRLKRYHDLTGNGVNHPNDFAHRVYAQTILALLTPAATEK